MNNTLLAFGLLKLLRINTSNFRPDLYDNDYENKYVVLITFGPNGDPYAKAKASVGLMLYFDHCLKFNKLQLTNRAKEQLVSAISEIICNAESHSKSNAPWVVLGRYEKETQSCSFSIISNGQTIYESLSASESTAKEVLKKVQEIVSSHASFWDKLKAAGGFCSQTEENTWNVMAIQEGISSKKTEEGDDFARGQGLMDFIESIGAISDDSAPRHLAIVSGASYLLHDFTYPIRRVKVRNSEKETRQISFNQSGQLHMPADSKYVYTLGTSYKGVIISGVFKVRSTLLQKAKAEG